MIIFSIALLLAANQTPSPETLGSTVQADQLKIPELHGDRLMKITQRDPAGGAGSGGNGGGNGGNGGGGNGGGGNGPDRRTGFA